MHRQVSAWLDAMAGVRSLPALEGIIDFWICRLGFRYFVYHGGFPGSPGGTEEVLLDTTPAEWREHCTRRGMDSKWDLLCTRALRAAAPVRWCRIKSLHPEVFAPAREFGLATGVTLPVHGAGGQWSSISFVKDRAGMRAERTLLATLPQCQLLTSLAHDAVARIVAPRSDASAPPHEPCESALSGRESECLGLAAAGRTMSQIAAVLPISERTVSFHLANARRKLGVGTLRHAVTKAASLGLIPAG
jgi:LuxR family transcriptional activator of bioluminescence operon